MVFVLRRFLPLLFIPLLLLFVVSLYPEILLAQQPVTLPTPTPRIDAPSAVPPALAATPIPAFTSLSTPTFSPATFDTVANAIVRIVSIGEYRRLFDGADARSLGTGTGFLVNEGGLIVTNAHVVNGGDDFQVYFNGETESTAATLLATDECSDIALLRLVPTDRALTSLAWRTTPAARGENVIAAGYPGGVAGLHITEGTVRQTGLRSFTDWASVPNVIDHTASVEPGNSGGPLLDSAGAVVGVVYARGSEPGDAAAIASEDAQSVIEALLAGDAGYRTGITGQAFSAEDDQFGVWVISVASDSYAAAAGVQPGDIIRRLNGRVVGRDGTMARYCQIVRDLALDAAVPVEIFRPNTNEVLSGALNGAALTPFRNLTAAAYPTATPVPTPVAAPLAPVVDETGALTFNAPSDWLYQLNDSVGFGSIVSARILGVGPSAVEYETGRALLRVVVGEITGLDPEQILDQTRDDLYCGDFERVAYADGSWQGLVDRCIGLHDPSYINAFLTSVERPMLFANVNFFVSQSDYPLDLAEVIAPLSERLLPALPIAERPSAVVQVDLLNVRTGPGLENSPITQVYRGESLPIAGKDTDACDWLFVAYSNLAGWVAAAPQYIALDRPCEELVVLTPQEIDAWQSGVE